MGLRSATLNSAIVTLRFPVIPTMNFTNRTTTLDLSSAMMIFSVNLQLVTVQRVMIVKLTNLI